MAGGFGRRSELRRERPDRETREVLERAVVDHVDLLGRNAERVDELPAAVAGVDDDRVDAVIQVVLGGGLAGARLARQQVVGGQDERSIGEQRPVEVLEVEPLEVDDVPGAGGSPVAEHVGDVLGELGGLSEPRSGRAGRVAVEGLADRVADGCRDRAVREAARDEPDVGAGPGERRGQCVVVRWRERRRVDDVNAHRSTSADRSARRMPGSGRVRRTGPGRGRSRASPARRRRCRSGDRGGAGPGRVQVRA